jgi:hypothetical protein
MKLGARGCMYCEGECNKECLPKDNFDNALDSFKDSLNKRYEPTLSEKLEKIVSKEPSKFIEESNERVRIKEEKVYNNVFHYQTRWLFDWLSKKDYLTDSREVIEKEFEEYLNK